MSYTCLRACVEDLERHGLLIRIKEEVDPYLEMAAIHRKIYEVGGPAVFYERVKGSPFPAVSNLFGTLDRARFIFRSTLHSVRCLIQVRANPGVFLKTPWNYLPLLSTASHLLPIRQRSGPILSGKTQLDRLPQIHCWPKDGGPFILLPQVYSEDPSKPGILHSNLGMYRVQLAGNRYQPNQQVGLHYQIRRDIGIHHTHALERGERLRVSIFVGGPPAHAFAAVFPLPEGLPEVALAGALAGRAFRYLRHQGAVLSSDADFCITGTIPPNVLLPEGPFGDHLGYYSLQHDFPVLDVDSVFHRRDAIWPFTVVGRPPQEDTVFGKLIHELTDPMVPVSLPGVKTLHAVDAAGVHPLLLAIGSERFTPYQERRPQEILTQAHSILGFGACSLAKYLWIAAQEDDPELNIKDIPQFFQHCLERVDWTQDLHFQTKTTMDTLDYSGTGLHQGSKVVIAVAGKKRRHLASALPENLLLPDFFKNPTVVMPGVLAIRGPDYQQEGIAAIQIETLTQSLHGRMSVNDWPLIVVVDDSEAVGRNFQNFLWVVFTRSNPSHDIHGVDAFIDHKHWGCKGPLIIDARLKPHHAPPLEDDPAILKRVEQLASNGHSLHGIF